MSFLGRDAALWGQRCLLLILLACLVSLLWQPIGLNIPPTEDDWNNYVLLDQMALDPTMAPPPDTSRPLLFIWWHIAYAIAPDSMLAVNWLMALAILLRAVAFYVIVSHLVQHRGWAAAAACLMVVIPLDFGVYEKGTFHIHVSTTLYFIAAALFFTLAKRFRPRMLIVLWGLLLLACGTYENVYPLIGLTPFLLLLKERRLTRSMLLLSVAWWSIPAVCAAAFFLPSLTVATSYQRDLLGSGLSPIVMIKTAGEAYIHVLAKDWYAAIRQEPNTFLVIRLIAGTAAAVYIWLVTRKASQPRLNMWTALLCSLLMIGAGFAMYLPTPLIAGGGGNRVHFLTAGGASLAVVVVSWIAARLLRLTIVFPLLIGFFVVIGLGSLMTMIRSGTLTHAYGQGHFLSSLVTQAPAIEPNTTLVFIFSPDVDNPFPDFQVGYLQNGVTYLYHDYSLRAYVCYDSDCSADLWHKLIPAQTVVFHVEPSLDLTLQSSVAALGTRYDPQKRLDMIAPLPRRWSTLYSQMSS
jgi:hypothetical protein